MAARAPGASAASASTVRDTVESEALEGAIKKALEEAIGILATRQHA
jgi:hypothetical protein